MKKCNIKGNSAFTLIELLVVVLIIGILAAVALPQYQRSILKSRYSTLFPLAKAFTEGNEVYYLEHGSYADDKSKLDIASEEPSVQATLDDTERHSYVKLTRSDINNNLIMYQKHSKNFPGEIHCEAKSDDSQANWLCEEGLQGTWINRSLTAGYDTYVIEGEGNGNFGKDYHSIGSAGLSDGDACISTVAYGCGGSSTLSNHAECIGDHYRSCKGLTFDDHASCSGVGERLCENGTFQNYSSCEGWSSLACRVNVSYTNHSTCTGQGINTCGGTFTTYSSCIGNSDQSCSGAKFYDHSVCHANVDGACANAQYDSTSCCAGEHCPSKARKCS